MSDEINFNEQGSTGPHRSPRSGYSPNRAARRRQARAMRSATPREGKRHHRRKISDHVDSDGVVHHNHHAHHHDGGCYVQIGELLWTGEPNESPIDGRQAWEVRLNHATGRTEETIVELRHRDYAWHCSCGQTFNCPDCGGDSCQHINATMEMIVRGDAA